MNLEIISGILSKYEDEQSSIIAILQDIQEHFGYLPKETLIDISKEINIPLSRILSLATFYAAFSLKT